MWSWKTFQVVCKWCMFKSRQTVCLVITAGCTQPLFLCWVPLHSVVCLRKKLFPSQVDVWDVTVCDPPVLMVITSQVEGAKLHHSAFRTSIMSTASKGNRLVGRCPHRFAFLLIFKYGRFGRHFLRWNYKSVHFLSKSLSVTMFNNFWLKMHSNRSIMSGIEINL